MAHEARGRAALGPRAQARAGDVDAGEARGHQLGLGRQRVERADVGHEQRAREGAAEDLLGARVDLALEDDLVAGLWGASGWVGGCVGRGGQFFRGAGGRGRR